MRRERKENRQDKAVRLTEINMKAFTYSVIEHKIQKVLERNNCKLEDVVLLSLSNFIEVYKDGVQIGKVYV
jgi:hypothetical protein